MQAIYVRVSTNQQDMRNQEQDLKAWAAREEAKGESVAWYEDKSTGTNFNRKDWQRLKVDLRASKISRLAAGSAGSHRRRDDSASGRAGEASSRLNLTARR